MPEWQERLTRDTKPSIRAEHDLRYHAAAPLIVGAPVWVDLGCGAGVAANDALGHSFAGHAMLVDASNDALQEAEVTVHASTITALQADLADEDDVARVRDAILDAGAGGCVTCFEVIEHLSTFVPVLELLVTLASEHDYTAVLSVPNDAFWALENPFHQTMWGEGAFEELRRLLPSEHTIAQQVPLTGSAIVGRAGATDLAVPAVAVEPDRVPSHFIAAFGPRADELVPRAFVSAADLDSQRTWERQREAQLAFHEAELAALREYVADLEMRLGRRPAKPADDGAPLAAVLPTKQK
jgi:2-polyprenyl-3-methyl-5-hydroxy-6-metoxy-1,4-benzoquinol methylase